MFDLRAALVCITLLQLLGCATDHTAGARATIDDVAIGMTQDQVLSILGQPALRETYGANEFLVYNVGNSGIPIAIVGGQVTSIGRSAYDVVVRSATRSEGNPSRSLPQ